jgi:hypothetical protein
METTESEFRGTLLNLKDGVSFFAIRDGENIFGKLFYIKSKKIHAKPNKTASMLLYLLARDEGDDIQYGTFKRLIEQKFTNIPQGGIDGFLDELKALKILDIETPTRSKEGVSNDEEADPVSLFVADGQINWVVEPPDLHVLDNQYLIDKRSHFYSSPSPGKKVNGWSIRRP